MPEDVKPEGTPAPGEADPTKNFKAELDRKLGSFATQLSETTEALKQQIASLTPKAPPPPANSHKSFKEQFYEDENQAVANLAHSIKRDIQGEIAMSNRQAEVLTSLYRDFPELADQSNDLTKKAVQIHKGLSEFERSSPGSYRLAVLEAAAEIGLPPKAKRKTETDPDAEGWTQSSTPQQTQSTRRKKGDLDPGTLQFAELMGFDVTDDKVVDRLKKSAARDTWTKYRPIKG